MAVSECSVRASETARFLVQIAMLTSIRVLGGGLFRLVSRSHGSAALHSRAACHADAVAERI
jgi:hypothetical protein